LHLHAVLSSELVLKVKYHAIERFPRLVQWLRVFLKRERCGCHLNLLASPAVHPRIQTIHLPISSVPERLTRLVLVDLGLTCFDRVATHVFSSGSNDGVSSKWSMSSMLFQSYLAEINVIRALIDTSVSLLAWRFDRPLTSFGKLQPERTKHVSKFLFFWDSTERYNCLLLIPLLRSLIFVIKPDTTNWFTIDSWL